MRIGIRENGLFHVHTYRCGHAQDVPDEAYVRQAIAMEAPEIWFSDHAPFPKDPFLQRMKYAELDEYLTTLQELKAKYRRQIDVHIGLEIEYFPTYDAQGYYQELKKNPAIEFLLLGQHMAQDPARPGEYSFSWPEEQLDLQEFRALGEAICQGIESGHFAAVAHPDRIFRRQKKWTPDMAAMSEKILRAAERAGLPIEINISSYLSGKLFRPEFWELAGDRCPILYGLDAHSLLELEEHDRVRRQLIVYRKCAECTKS